MDAEAFWSVRRSTKPQSLFEELLPQVPIKLPQLTLPRPVHVKVTGQGVWTVRLVDGRPQVLAGAHGHPYGVLTMDRGTLREVVAGALRDRALKVMERLGKPRQVPDLRFVRVEPDRLERCAEIDGQVTVALYDREYAETYHFHWSFGPAIDDARPHTTIVVDADSPMQWVIDRADPRQLLRSSGVRLEGDLTLPVRVLQILFDR